MPRWDTALLALFAVSDSTEMACFQIRMGNTNKGIKRKRVKAQKCNMPTIRPQPKKPGILFDSRPCAPRLELADVTQQDHTPSHLHAAG